MVDCRTPLNSWERFQCWAPQIFTTAAAVTEAARSRWFYRDYAIEHRGVSVHIPRPGKPVISGTVVVHNQEALTALGKLGTVEGMAFYPAFFRREFLHTVSRGSGFAADLWFSYQSASRIWNGESELEGTTNADSLFLVQGAVGTVAVFSSTRYGRARGGLISLPIAVIGAMAAGQNAVAAVRANGWDSPQVKMVASHLALGALNYSLGVGLKEGAYDRHGPNGRLREGFLTKDRRMRASAKAGPITGRWDVRGVDLAAREQRLWDPHLIDFENPGLGRVQTHETILAVRDRDRSGSERYVGYAGLHQPTRNGAIPQVTYVMDGTATGIGILPRLRAHLLRHTDHGPSLRRGWETQAASVYIQREGYTNSLIGTGMRVSAWTPTHHWEGDVTGEWVLMNRANAIIRRDHRYRPIWVGGRDNLPQAAARYMAGTIRNGVDTIRDTRSLVAKVAVTPRTYFGHSAHPQPQGPVCWRTQRRAERPPQREREPAMVPDPAYMDRSPGAG
ncbi:MAG: hypothetical protein Q7S98_00860, partial [Deltaproteobacteria bacterium]|nr:hypothetical protein [Deltaproteobacteria bacterium]